MEAPHKEEVPEEIGGKDRGLRVDTDGHQIQGKRDR